MKNTKRTLIVAIFTGQIDICQINTPGQIIQGNTGATSTNVSIGTTNGVNPNAKLEIQNSGNQLRLSNSPTIYSDITTNSSGYLVFNSTGNKVGFGPNLSLSASGFHSNLGRFLVTDNYKDHVSIEKYPDLMLTIGYAYTFGNKNKVSK